MGMCGLIISQAPSNFYAECPGGILTLLHAGHHLDAEHHLDAGHHLDAESVASLEQYEWPEIVDAVKPNASDQRD